MTIPTTAAFATEQVHRCDPPGRRAPLAWLAALTLVVCGSASAQYKVVLPDGSTTYTDRPPATQNARITSLNRKGTTLSAEGVSSNSGLPLELRQAAQRYPVTLYTGPDCTPCDNGRRFLQLRGVPFSEKRIGSEDDAVLLERAVGGRTVPALTIGAQALRGLSETDWTAFLDAAGYPRESKLPRNWQAPAVQPMGEKTAAKPAAPAKPETPEIPEAPQPTTGTRF